MSQMTASVNILTEVEDYIVSLLTTELPEEFTYHSVHHTRDVVAFALEIARMQNIEEPDTEIVQIAAWFHDLGYIQGCDNHEQRSVKMANKFLIEKGYPNQWIKKIEGCIWATRMPQNPKNELEKIICDADLLHLASDDYFVKADLMFKEIQKTKSRKVSNDEWLQMNHDFLKNHVFFTDYAKEHYTPFVKRNLTKVDERLMLNK